MPWNKMQAKYRGGRGFLGARGFVGASQAAPAAAAERKDAAPNARETRRQTQAEDRQRANDAEREERMASWRQQRGAQERATGTYGFKGFYKGRPELTGTNPYYHDWLTTSRPPIHEGVGPLGGRSRLGEHIETETGAHADANAALGETTSGDFPQPLSFRGSASAPDAEPESSSFPTTPRLSGGSASSWPRNGALRPGSQFSKVLGI